MPVCIQLIQLTVLISFKRMPRVKLNKNNDQHNTLALVTGQSTHFD